MNCPLCQKSLDICQCTTQDYNDTEEAIFESRWWEDFLKPDFQVAYIPTPYGVSEVLLPW